ncbi:MAG: hypothetical protein KAJ73_00305 [Zetaproteobacteria bacterium]|nr:hypothetical protein [Zetaproteobacteria bacterium]
MPNYYYSGQGSLYVAERDVDGSPKAMIPVGNVPNLEVSIEVTKFEHKESETGQRAVDLSIIQEKKGTLTMTLENINAYNLAMAFWGQSVINAAAVAQAQVVTAYLGYKTKLALPAVSTVLVTDDATKIIDYEFGTAVDDLVNSLNGWIDEANGSMHIFTDAEQTTRGAAANITDLELLEVTCDNADSVSMEAFTTTTMERYLVFEGLNTIDEKAVRIEIFKAQLDPLSGYGLINEELAALEVNGTILSDALQTGDSKFFSQINVD